MKSICLLTRRHDFSRDDFKAYYEERHAVLGSEYFPFSKYLRSFVVSVAGEEIDFDAYSEFYQDVALAQQLMAGPVGEIFVADEQRFMDRSLIRPAHSVERLLGGTPRDVARPGTHRQLLLLRAGGRPAAEFPDRVEAWGRSLHAEHGAALERVTLDLPTAFPNVVFPYDAVLSLWPADGTGKLEVAAPAGIELAAAVLTEICETPPDLLASRYRGQAA